MCSDSILSFYCLLPSLIFLYRLDTNTETDSTPLLSPLLLYSVDLPFISKTNQTNKQNFKCWNLLMYLSDMHAACHRRCQQSFPEWTTLYIQSTVLNLKSQNSFRHVLILSLSNINTSRCTKMQDKVSSGKKFLSIICLKMQLCLIFCIGCSEAYIFKVS